MNVASRMSPPTSSGAAVRVFANVAVELPSPVIWLVGWNFHRLLRYSRITGAVNVARAPTRIGFAFESHGIGVFLALPV